MSLRTSDCVLKPASMQLRRRHLLMALPALAFGLVVAPVQARTGTHQASRVLMGTRVDLTLQGADDGLLETAANDAFTEMTRLADMMSRYRSTSVLNAINLSAGLQAVPVPPEMMRVLSMAQQAARNSDGAFDALVGSLKDWNFDPQHPATPSDRQIAQQLPLVSVKGLVLDEHRGTAYLTTRGMRLDLGGIAKLPILQAGLHRLQRMGITNGMINGGGDVVVMGQMNGRPWRVGLRDPRQPDRILGTVSLNHGWVAASGDYERYFMRDGKRMHHILDPKTGYPTHGPRGVALISDKLEDINGLGAAIMVSGMEVGQQRVALSAGLDAMIVGADNSVWLSPGMRRHLALA